MAGSQREVRSPFSLRAQVIVDLEADEMAHCRPKLEMTEQYLHGSQILRPNVGQRRLRPTHRMRAVGSMPLT